MAKTQRSTQAKAPEPDGIAPGMSPDKFMEYFRRVRKLEFNKDRHVAFLRLALKEFKSDGGSTEAMALLRRFSKMDPEEAKAVIAQFGFYSVVSKQGYSDLPLFAAASNLAGTTEKTTELQVMDDAEHAGRLVGCAGGNKNGNPFLAGSPRFAAWDIGFDNGWAFFEQQPASTQREKPAESRGRGRPPGAENKATIAKREAAEKTKAAAAGNGATNGHAKPPEPTQADATAADPAAPPPAPEATVAGTQTVQ